MATMALPFVIFGYGWHPRWLTTDFHKWFHPLKLEFQVCPCFLSVPMSSSIGSRMDSTSSCIRFKESPQWNSSLLYISFYLMGLLTFTKGNILFFKIWKIIKGFTALSEMQSSFLQGKYHSNFFFVITYLHRSNVVSKLQIVSKDGNRNWELTYLG